MICTPSTSLIMLLVPWHSFTISVQTRMWSWIFLTSLKHHSLHPYAHIQPTIQRQVGRSWIYLLGEGFISISPPFTFFPEGSSFVRDLLLGLRQSFGPDTITPLTSLCLSPHTPQVCRQYFSCCKAVTIISLNHLNEAKGFSKSKGFASFIKQSNYAV